VAVVVVVIIAAVALLLLLLLLYAVQEVDFAYVVRFSSKMLVTLKLNGQPHKLRKDKGKYFGHFATPLSNV